MSEHDSRSALPMPSDVHAIEHFRRLELGFSTLKEQCLFLDPDQVDSEIGARFVQLYELWCWGCPIDAIDVQTPAQNRLRHSSAARIAGLCQVMLERVADDKFVDGIAGVN